MHTKTVLIHTAMHRHAHTCAHTTSTHLEDHLTGLPWTVSAAQPNPLLMQESLPAVHAVHAETHAGEGVQTAAAQLNTLLRQVTLLGVHAVVCGVHAGVQTAVS